METGSNRNRTCRLIGPTSRAAKSQETRRERVDQAGGMERWVGSPSGGRMKTWIKTSASWIHLNARKQAFKQMKMVF